MQRADHSVVLPTWSKASPDSRTDRLSVIGVGNALRPSIRSIDLLPPVTTPSEERMTILEVTAVPFSEHHRGGGESYPWRLAEELSHFEDVVSCFVTEPGTVLPAGQVVTIPGSFLDVPPLFTRHNPIPNVGSVRTIDRILRGEGKVEFVHIHNLRTAMSTAWLILGRLRRHGHRYKVLLTDHGARWFPFPSMTAPLADYFVPVSQASSDWLAQYARRPSFVLPPGVPTQYPGLARSPRPYSERDIDLIFFGRIAPWKRPDLALSLADELRPPGAPPPRVVIAGSVVDPKYFEWLRREATQRQLSETTRFILNPTEIEAAELLSRSKVHVLLSSSVDAFGRRFPLPELAGATILEAAACGTPSICSDLPGIREQVPDPRAGLLFPLSAWPELVRAAGILLSDPVGWEAMSNAARRFVEGERTYHVLAQRLSGFLGRIRRGEL
jgi:glycosyltransferase involved in cell wall biosynthesis